MDFKMKVVEKTGNGVYWDCKVQDGNVQIIYDGEEDLQCATLAGFLVRGTIPLLPQAGVPWSEFLTSKMTFGELDFYVRQSLQDVGKETYYPQYDIENDQLTMSIGKMDNSEELSEYTD